MRLGEGDITNTTEQNKRKISSSNKLRTVNSIFFPLLELRRRYFLPDSSCYKSKLLLLRSIGLVNHRYFVASPRIISAYDGFFFNHKRPSYLSVGFESKITNINETYKLCRFFFQKNKTKVQRICQSDPNRRLQTQMKVVTSQPGIRIQINITSVFFAEIGKALIYCNKRIFQTLNQYVCTFSQRLFISSDLTAIYETCIHPLHYRPCGTDHSTLSSFTKVLL